MRDFVKENYYINKDRTINEFAKINGGVLPVCSISV